METVRASGQVVGPGVGGWLVGLVGAAAVVGVQAVTFAVSALCLLAIRTREAAPAVRVEGTRLRGEIRDGLAFVWHHPFLRATAITSAAGNFAFAVASAVTFVFMAQTIGLSPAVIGAIIAAGSVTVMVGAALTTRLSHRVGSARIVWLSLAVTGPLTLLGPFAQSGDAWSIALLVVGAAAGEVGQIVYAITSVSLRQRLCPPHLLGRVSATMRFLIMGLFPVGALLGGVLGEIVGPRTTLWVYGAIVTLSCLPVLAVIRRRRDVEEVPGWVTADDRLTP
jgi:MFS family permease